MANDPTTKTALDLITGALRKIGQYAPGEAISAADANDALDSFNGLLDMWSSQKLAVFNTIETVLNLTAGQSTYTLGVGGYFNIERPLRIVRAYSRLNSTGSSSVDFPCQITGLEKYTNIGMKNQPGPWPKIAFYNPTYPLSTLIVWPVPQRNIEFHMWSEIVLSSMSLSTVLNLPRGYYMSLQFALAELLCPEYGMAVPIDIKRMAKEFKGVVKALNGNPQTETGVDGAIAANGGINAGFVLTGGF